MRQQTQRAGFMLKAFSGTHAVLIAIDCDEERRKNLLGFSIRREQAGKKGKWLRSQKVFRSLVPEPRPGERYSSWDHPIQSFQWGDYSAEPDASYEFVIVPTYGTPDTPRRAPALKFTIRTERTIANGHGVWFNRGVIASQAFARAFGNKPPAAPGDPDDPETAWLSRGLLEACLAFIRETPEGDALRVAAYELTYPPILTELSLALRRGVDVKIVYHADPEGKNDEAIEAAELPRMFDRHKVLFKRTKTKIPHNKFIVHLEKGETPVAVWTGSTNFTVSGFLGQSNVGHLVIDESVANTYMKYWRLLSDDPDRDELRPEVMALTPNPPKIIEPNSVSCLFSPRPSSTAMLKWYGDRMEDATTTLMFTAAFGVTAKLVEPLARERDVLRFVLMEKPPTDAQHTIFQRDRDLVVAYGAVLGEMYVFKDGKPTARRPIAEFELDKWFLQEELPRRPGHVFFVHDKFLLIDPLSNDPLICTGSANFSPNSLLANDENMLLIRGDTRVADIYLTEFDRILRHFYFRDIANELAAKGRRAKSAFLDETDGWTESYFKPGAVKSRRREMFFKDPAISWASGRRRQPTLQTERTSERVAEMLGKSDNRHVEAIIRRSRRQPRARSRA